MVQVLAVMLRAQLKLVRVDQKFRQVEKLGDELTYVRRVLSCSSTALDDEPCPTTCTEKYQLRRRLPCLLNRVEHAVGMVKMATLQRQEHLQR